jgi:hypothetical protein
VRHRWAIAAAAALALVGSSAATAGPPRDTDFLLAAGSFGGCCGWENHLWVNAWIDPRRENIYRGLLLWDDDPDLDFWFGIDCLNVQGNEAAVVGHDSPIYYGLVLRDNGRKPDEVISERYGFTQSPGCAFVPGQQAQWIFDGDVNIHDSPSWP